jgi:Rod binding domain-containing protein
LQALQATIKSDKDNADKVVQQLQSRLDRIEAGGIGRQEVATETTQARQYSTQFSMGMIALAIAFAAVIVPIIIKLVP